MLKAAEIWPEENESKIFLELYRKIITASASTSRRSSKAVTPSS